MRFPPNAADWIASAMGYGVDLSPKEAQVVAHIVSLVRAQEIAGAYVVVSKPKKACRA